MTRFNITREFYIPKGATKITPKAVNAEFYIYDNNGPCAMFFKGRAQKPTWRYRFRNEAKRETRIRETIESLTEHERLKVERRKARNNPGNLPFIGAILNTCWGYDQTNREFFQVVGHKGKTTLILREIAQATHYTQDMAGNTAPINDDFIGKPIERRWNGHSAKIDDVRRASPWSGKPVSFSEYH